MPNDRIDVPGDDAWRARRRDELLTFASRARLDTGFGRLGRDGVPAADVLELWINARMTYVFSDAAARGSGSYRALGEHGVRALGTLFTDAEHGGWFSEVGADGVPVVETKSCYDHAFVLLAAATAHGAGIAGAGELLDQAAEIHLRHFWREDTRRCVDLCSRDWTETSPYRGANANMHTVEAYLAVARGGGGAAWLQRALDIAHFFTDEQARANGWRLPEHYDAHWRPELDHNVDRVDDPFRPYGATPGHGLEWSRLLLELEDQLGAGAPGWLLDNAVHLFDRAAADSVTAVPGLPYTTDWEGRVVVPARFHWVIAEAVQAAAALWRRTGEPRYRDLGDRWWSEIDRYFVQGETGLWNHELDADLRVAGGTWPDAPDAYHAYNALTS